jgi:hypothetical protein
MRVLNTLWLVVLPHATASYRCDGFISSVPDHRNDFQDLQSAIDGVAPGSTICYRRSSSPYACEDAVANKSVTIASEHGMLGSVVIDCRGSSRFLRVISSIQPSPSPPPAPFDTALNVSLDSLVLQGGMAAVGGLIYAEGVSLRVSNSRLTNSSSTCQVSQEHDGKIVYSSDCYNTYPLRDTLHSSTPLQQAHSLPEVGGGGGIYAVNCNIEIDSSEFSALQAGSFGGAILSVNGNIHRFSNNKFVGNHAAVVAAGVALVYWGDASNKLHQFHNNTFHTKLP